MAAPPSDKRREVAKARRAVLKDGSGGMQVRKKAKRSEQKKPASGKGFGAQTGALKSAAADATSTAAKDTTAAAEEIKKEQSDEPQDPDAPVDVSELTGESEEKKDK